MLKPEALHTTGLLLLPKICTATTPHLLCSLTMPNNLPGKTSEPLPEHSNSILYSDEKQMASLYGEGLSRYPKTPSLSSTILFDEQSTRNLRASCPG
ncbi:uncharacterized protein BCR38DRAFT_437037 [Pseudomassariella vexata]|uniref:Uncharacterized protein n=1 Tax=Pseudomassariella vexata TaxID=1141098 RepID=A0A1Y2DWK2_9PEZI|nr:uncharacterized protein BCR38DRAFT_437037 [Pseudomassariella vexata]ORY63516.1 hypothetical protein BCR38DRAFT_437037 [Pseudomassariella vexata]